jgi:plasmid stability protein
MANIALSNIPDPLYEALSQRAAKHKHTVEQEAIDCLDLGLRVSDHYVDSVEQKLSDLRQFRDSLGSIHVTENELQNAKREGRP